MTFSLSCWYKFSLDNCSKTCSFLLLMQNAAAVTKTYSVSIYICVDIHDLGRWRCTMYWDKHWCKKMLMAGSQSRSLLGFKHPHQKNYLIPHTVFFVAYSHFQLKTTLFPAEESLIYIYVLRNNYSESCLLLLADCALVLAIILPSGVWRSDIRIFTPSFYFVHLSKKQLMVLAFPISNSVSEIPFES